MHFVCGAGLLVHADGVLGRRCILLLALVGLSPAYAHAAVTHEVRKGDTLWGLAQEHGCSVEQLRKANALERGGLRVGMRLRVPSCGKPTKPPKFHTVARGDTLSALAKKHGTSVDALRTANGLTSDVIHVGQKLVIASSESAPAPIRMVKGQSVGAPQNGKLVEGAQLPRSRTYYRRRIPRTFAAAHVVDQLTIALAAVRAEHPKALRVAIGDLSDEDGGAISGHNSHQSGRDVDIGLYFVSRPAGYPKEFVPAKAGKLDVAAMWTLLDTLHQQSKKDGGPTKIFLDYKIQKQVYQHAKKQGVSGKRLKKIFAYPDGRWAGGRLVQHLRNHHDHLHVRYGCPPKDDDCKGG